MAAPRTDEQGAVAVITAIVLTVLLLASAFIIDLGALRADKIAGKAIADMAASAAAVQYVPTDAGAPNEACNEALAYAVANLRGSHGAAVAEPNRSCDQVYPPSYVCQPGDDKQAVYTVGPYRIEITLPVRNAPNDRDLLQGLSHDAEFDGGPCDRIGVRVFNERDFLLGGFTGRSEGTTSPGSVAKVARGTDGEFASLVVLQRTGCETLYSTGSGQLRVNRLDLPSGKTYKGIISIDTQPSGCAAAVNQQKKIIRAGGNSLIWADGAIREYSLATTDPGNTYSYQSGAVGSSATSPGNLWPRPEAGEMVTRAIVDHLYNCQPGGYGSAVYEPDSSQPIDPCDEDPPPPPYMQYLHDWLGTGPGAPAGVWYDPGTAICNKNAGPIAVPANTPNVFIDCPGGFEPDEVTITGARHVVVNGTLNMGNSESLTITGPPEGTTLVLRDGDFNRTGGDLRLRDVFTYAVSGELDIRGTSGDLWWKGPDRLDSAAAKAACMPTVGQPTASCFGPLAYWGNGSVTNSIRGEASGGVVGSIFTPNARTELRGGQSVDSSPCGAVPSWNDLVNNTGSLNLAGAQFFSETFYFAGSSGLRMCPNPNLLTTSGWSSHLIR